MVNARESGDLPPATSDPQLVIDSGLNWFAVQLLAESAAKAPVLAHFGELSIDVGGVRVTVKKLPAAARSST